MNSEEDSFFFSTPQQDPVSSLIYYNLHNPKEEDGFLESINGVSTSTTTASSFYDEDGYHNQSDILDVDEVPFEFPFNVRIICYVLYNLVFVCGFLGNILVYYTIHFTNPRMKTVQNLFLANLALGDLLIVVFCVPTGYIDILWQYWPFGVVACHVLTPIKAVGVFISSYTLIALAIDRYLAILYPLNLGLGRRQCNIIIFVIWMAAILTALPVSIYSRVEFHFATSLPRCGEYGWESHVDELIYSIVLLCLQYLFPVCVLIFTYSRISLVVWGNGRNSRRDGSQSWMFNGSTQTSVPNKGKRKTIILSLAVVTGFTLAWFPYNVIYMLYKHGPEWIIEMDSFPYIFLICHFLAMSHTTFNFTLYYFLNSKFRSSFVQVFCNKCPCLSKILWGSRRDVTQNGRGSSIGTRPGIGGRSSSTTGMTGSGMLTNTRITMMNNGPRVSSSLKNGDGGLCRVINNNGIDTETAATTMLVRVPLQGNPETKKVDKETDVAVDL